MRSLNARRSVISLIAALFFLTVGSAHASCVITSPQESEVGKPYQLTKGQQRLTLLCDLTHPAIFHFPRNYVKQATLYLVEPQELVVQEQLLSARQAFLLAPGSNIYQLDIDAQYGKFLYPEVSSIIAYQAFNTIHTLTISAFVGFCFALVIYVGVLGNSMQNRGFYSYSFYIASAAIFFLLQEGLLHTLFPNVQFLNSLQLIVFFAGVTVFTSLRFIDQLLDLTALLKKWHRKVLLSLALIMLVIAGVQLLLSSDASMVANTIFTYLTLLIMTGKFLAIVYAVSRKVHCARLVLLGVCLLNVAMLSRFYLSEFNPFLQRYGLIIGVTIEALIFAFAAAQKVKKLNDDKMAAYQRAATDPMCHILNRSGWEGAAKILLDEFSRHGGYLTLMFIDIDNFKHINDSHGHHAGDDVLRIMSSILKRQCREQDVVGRFGGDEFVVMSYCYSRSQSERLISRIQLRLSDVLIQTSNDQIPVTASVGGVITDKITKDLDTLLQEADVLMYKAKKNNHSDASAASV